MNLGWDKERIEEFINNDKPVVIIDEEYFKENFISKDKIIEKIKELKKECIDCSFRKMLNCKKQCTIGGTIKALEDLLKE